MRMRRHALPVLIGAVIVAVLATAIVSNRLFGGLTESVEEREFEQMEAIVTFDLAGAEQRALARAEMLAQLPSLQEAFKAGDRDRLLAEFAAMFKEQQDKYGVDQLQMQVPPAITFLRFQAPDSFGDDVSKTRPMVVAINRDHVTRQAPAIGRTGPALYGIVAVEDAGGAYVGSLEVGMSFGAVLDNLKAAYGLELALFIEEEPLRTLAPGVDPAVLDEGNRVGKYLKYHATHWELLRDLVGADDVRAVTASTHYTRSAMGRPYGVLLVPIHNAADQPLGVMVVAKSFEGTRAAAGRSLIWQGLISLFAIVALAGVILVVVRGMLLQPLGVLSMRFGEVAAGRRERPADDVDGLCSELQELAGHHETLRTSNPAPDEDKPA